MNRLLKIAQSTVPATGVQFRRRIYGARGVRHFLRDVLAMANARIEAQRYIVVGADFDARGSKTLHQVPENDFGGKPSYQDLVTDFIEPPIRLRYHSVNMDGKRIGVFEIGDCQDRPYMMKADYSERLRRGDAYIRVDGTPIKMGRRQLQELFEQKFRDSVSSDRIEIGFPGEIIHKALRLQTTDLSQLPSAVASSKLKQMIDIRTRSKNSGSTTAIARLTHARLFGSDDPYEDRSPTILLGEMAAIKNKYRNEDQFYLFEKNAQKIQLVVYNQGDEPIQDASLALNMPNLNAFNVANRLPRLRRQGSFVERGPAKLADYPSVSLQDDAVQVSNTLGEIPVNTLVEVFDTPLRICVGSDLRGRRLGIRFSLFGSNLREPAQGTLRLIF